MVEALLGRLSIAETLACAFVVAAGSDLRAQGTPTLGRRDCTTVTSVVPAVSPDSIGYLRLDEPLARLREPCTARDTTARLGGAASSAYPGLVFPFDSLTVIALQYGGATLDPGRAADGWIILGTRATIQRKVPLSAPWSALHAALGTVQANARGVLAVRFCSFPNAIITLNTDPGAVVIRGGQVDLSSIPADATIHHMFIMSRSLAGHLLGC